jgi:hypothetical protein
MKMKWILLVLLLFLGMATHVQAQPLATQALVVTGLQAEGNCFCNPAEGLFGKRKKKHKAKLFAIGAVVGAPVGFGGRVIVRPTRLAFAGDIAFNRLRTDLGPMVNAVVVKADARYYSKGIISKLLRPYIFTGLTMQRGRFDETQVQSVYALDAGVGAGIKLWRLEINGEAGILLPVRQVQAYRPGLGVLANVGVMWWLF